MILPPGEFTYATFYSDDKTLIRAIFHDDNDDWETYHEIIIPVDLEDQNYQKLLETFDLEQINKMTNEERAVQRENFLEVVKEVAEKSGMIYDPESANIENHLRIDHLFKLPDDELGEEFLFNIKLNIFEMEKVMHSDDADLKKRLREATSPIECFYIAGKFLYE